MNLKEAGASLKGEAPAAQAGAGLASTCCNNYSAKQQARKLPSKTLSGTWNRQATKARLQAYLDLGLTPIPLRGKIPIVKWLHGNWNPKTIEDLEPYKNRVNWGLRTGGNFAVIDFDSHEIFAKFAAENIEQLPDSLPLIKTGRGYHLWFRPAQPLKGKHFNGIDLKGEGGLVVAPPSIHPKTNRPYRFLWQLGDSIPELDITKLKFPEPKKETNEESVKKADNGNGKCGRIPADKPKFDYELIKDGVGEGKRHTALVSYIGHLIWRGLSKQEIMILVTDWNEKNRPPLSKEELVVTVDYCCNRYAKEETADKNAVSTKTLSKLNSVIVETKPLPADKPQTFSLHS